jgi:tetratricopeptide (TPR) repeat protein
MAVSAWWLKRRRPGRELFRLTPVLFLSLVAGLVSIWTQKMQGHESPQFASSLAERLAAGGDAVWFYLGKLLFPHPLLTVYPRWQIDPGNILCYGGLLGALALLAVLWWKRNGWARPYFFAYAYFLLALLPALGLANLVYFRFSFVADHLQYLASIGPLALAGAGLVRLGEMFPANRTGLPSIFGAGLLLLLGALSWRQAGFYETEVTLWNHTLAYNPACWVGYNNLGNVFAHEQRPDEAIQQYQHALELYPAYAEAHNNLGAALFKEGQIEAAMAEYRAALQINPNFADAYNNLGNAFAREGRPDEAMAEYGKGLAIDPYFVDVRNHLGSLLEDKGRSAEAVEQFRKALEINPNDAGTHYNLGNTFLRHGRPQEAVGEYEKALKIDPASAPFHNNLGSAFAALGRLDEAIAEYQKALELEPAYAEADNDLAIALFRKGKADQAIALLREALRLAPDNGQMRANLAKMEELAAKKAGSAGTGPGK